MLLRFLTPELRRHISSQPGMSNYFNTVESPPVNYATTTPWQTRGAGASNIGTLNYGDTSRNYSVSNLPDVTDPNKAFADIAEQQHEYLIREFRPYEEALLSSVNDTSLVDAVPEDVIEQSRLAREIDERNRARYGYTRTRPEEQEIEREMQRAETIGLAGGLNDARLAQRERNQGLLAGLVNVGRNVNQGTLDQFANASQMQSQRENAYRSDRAQSKAQRWGFLGML